jgi:hypothetical protein
MKEVKLDSKFRLKCFRMCLKWDVARAVTKGGSQQRDYFFRREQKIYLQS